MLQSTTSRSYENHHLILDHIDSHLSADIEDHIPHFYKKSTSISSTSSPEPQHYTHHVYRAPPPPPQSHHQQFRVIKDGRMYEEGYQVSSSDLKPIEMPPPVQHHGQKVKIISNEEPTSSIPDLGEYFLWFILYCASLGSWKWGKNSRQNRFFNGREKMKLGIKMGGFWGVLNF